LVAAGYATRTIPGSIDLGWLTAVLAILTAYIRLLGGITGTKQYFIGPMAKQHRMAIMIAACLLSVLEEIILISALCLIACGSFITIIRRLKHILADLESGVTGLPLFINN
jgi:hypothetical protein